MDYSFETAVQEQAEEDGVLGEREEQPGRVKKLGRRINGGLGRLTCTHAETHSDVG